MNLLLVADLSHFELVIERLQEQAARDKEDSVCPAGEDEGLEEVHNTHVWTLFQFFMYCIRLSH